MTRTFTLDELEAAFNRHAMIHGREKALADLERTTGARHIFSVPKHKITPAMVVLVGGRCIFDGMFARRPEVRRSRWLS